MKWKWERKSEQNREQEGKTDFIWGIGTSEKGGYKESVNMLEILCTHVCKWKNDLCWTSLGTGGRGIKENDGRGEFKYDIL
jgi:hypothetical protein